MSESIWISPLAPSVIKAAANLCNRHKENPIGFIISENQVAGQSPGYTGFSNETLLESFSDFKRKPAVSRDHSSCQKLSLEYDAKSLSGIHIDPFKHPEFGEPFSASLFAIETCHAANKSLFYEVATEEAVLTFGPEYLKQFLGYLQTNLLNRYSNVRYAVIQCGTLLHNGQNCRQPDEGMFKAMVKVCKEYGVMSKVHNSDFVSNKTICRQAQIAEGRAAYNICPEVGFVISTTIYDNVSDKEQKALFNLVRQHRYLTRWFDIEYDFEGNKRNVVGNLLHYLYAQREVREMAGPWEKLILEHLEDWLAGKILAAAGKSA